MQRVSDETFSKIATLKTKKEYDKITFRWIFRKIRLWWMEMIGLGSEPCPCAGLVFEVLTIFQGCDLTSLLVLKLHSVVGKMINEGAISTNGGNRNTRRKPTTVSLFPPQNLHDLTWDRPRACLVGTQRLTSWDVGRPWTSGFCFQRDYCDNNNLTNTTKYTDVRPI